MGVPRNFQSGNEGGFTCISFRPADGVWPELLFPPPTLKQIDTIAIVRISLETLAVFSISDLRSRLALLFCNKVLPGQAANSIPPVGRFKVAYKRLREVSATGCFLFSTYFFLQFSF